MRSRPPQHGRTLEVFVSDRRVGILSESPETGLVDFDYEAEVDPDFAVSLTMPVVAEHDAYHEFNGLPPPFEICLPEGLLLDLIRARFAKHVEIDDDLSLLHLIGRHTVGRVTFGGPLAPDEELDARILEAARSDQSAQALLDILSTLPERFGISGVMPKMSGGPRQTRPGTLVREKFIVKFDTHQYAGASLIEHACLQACERAGLNGAHSTLAPDARSIRVRRFDLAQDGTRLGFEDACALSGLRRTGKYSGSVEHLVRMIRHYGDLSYQREDLEMLLRAIVMNDVLRNGDAHLKNFGLLYGCIERARLAPIYDVLTTQIWLPRDTPALSLRMSDEDKRWLDKAGMEDLVDLTGLWEIDVGRIRDEMAEIAVSTMQAIAKDHPPDAGPHARALHEAIAVVERAAVSARP